MSLGGYMMKDENNSQRENRRSLLKLEIIAQI